jgi:LEA14-like dessication related protein
MHSAKGHGFKLALAFSILVLALSSCVHLAESFGLVPKKPDISLVDFQVKSLSVSTIDVEVVISVLNNDHRELAVDRLSFDLFLTDTKLGVGSIAEKIAVRPNAEQKVRIPIALQTKELMGAAMSLMSGKAKENARIRGSADITTWLGSLTIPFDREFSKKL